MGFNSWFEGLNCLPILQLTRCTCYLKLFIIIKHSTCFGGLSVHHQEFKTAYTATVSVKQLLIPAAIWDDMKLSISSPIAAGSSSCLTDTVALYAVLNSWWWMERPPKHVERFTREITGASCWLYYRNILQCTDTRILNFNCLKSEDGRLASLLHLLTIIYIYIYIYIYILT